MDLNSLLTIAQTGQMLGKSYCGVRDMILTRKLEGFQLGRQWFVQRDSVEAYLQRERDTAEAVR